MENKFSESNIWESNSPDSFIIDESNSSSEVDGVHILAKVEGPAFFPETTSRNRVHYSNEAWESAISDPTFKSRLQDRLVYGTIGHNIDLTDDDIREGRFSHIVTRVWINEENIGRAEYLVLNTPPGRILNTLLRAKSKLRVSTKAAGFFESAKDKSGVKKVIPDKFKLERIDFVIDPGYFEAIPELLESLQEDLSATNLLTEGKHMTKEVVDILEARVKELKDEKQISESKANELQAQITEIRESHAKVATLLESYQTLGTFPAVQESMSELAQYQKIGPVHQIIEAMEAGEEVIDDLSDKIETLEKAAEEQPNEYSELGAPADIKTALEQALTVTDQLAAYKALGSVEELQELINQSAAMAEALEQEEAQKCADTFGVDVSVVNELSAKGMSLDEVKEFLAKVKPVAEAPAAPVETPAPTNESGEDEPTGEGETEEEKAARLAAEEEEARKKEEEEKAAAAAASQNASESISSTTLRLMRAGVKPEKIQESNKVSPAKSLAMRLMTTRR